MFPCSFPALFGRRLPAAAARAAVLILAILGPAKTESAVANGDTRTIYLHHLHTGESIAATFKKDGRYDPHVLRELNRFLRDWRNNDETNMDPRLFDVVWETYQYSGSRQPIQIVSAYRSPATNAMLRRRTFGVARRSQHMLGKAMDMHYVDVPMSKIRAIGMRLERGGVGYYPTSGTPFVHLDVGHIRYWPRMSYTQLAHLFPDGKSVFKAADGRVLPHYEQALAEVDARQTAGFANPVVANAAPSQPTVSLASLRTSEEPAAAQRLVEQPSSPAWPPSAPVRARAVAQTLAPVLPPILPPTRDDAPKPAPEAPLAAPLPHSRPIERQAEQQGEQADDDEEDASSEPASRAPTPSAGALDLAAVAQFLGTQDSGQGPAPQQTAARGTAAREAPHQDAIAQLVAAQDRTARAAIAYHAVDPDTDQQSPGRENQSQQALSRQILNRQEASQQDAATDALLPSADIPSHRPRRALASIAPEPVRAQPESAPVVEAFAEVPPPKRMLVWVKGAPPAVQATAAPTSEPRPAVAHAAPAVAVEPAPAAETPLPPMRPADIVVASAEPPAPAAPVRVVTAPARAPEPAHESAGERAARTNVVAFAFFPNAMMPTRFERGTPALSAAAFSRRRARRYASLRN